MATPETQSRFELKIRSPWAKSSAWARILVDGSLELELYDFSPEAQQSMGNDVAWIWTVESQHMPTLIERLPNLAHGSDQALVQYLILAFVDVHAIRDWIRQQEIPLREDFDSWA